MQFVVFEKFIRVLIYPKLHEKNLVNTCKNLTFSFLRVTACRRSLLQLTNDNFDQDNGQNFDRWILIDKIAETRNLLTENWCLLSFYVFNFLCFSTAATERNTTATKIPLLCIIYLGFGWGKRHNGGFIDGFFCSSCRLLQQSEEKTKAFLTSLTSFQELHLMWVWVTPFFVSFNEHNYFNFLTVTRTINLRRCMASDLKYTSFSKTGRRFIENASCGVCSSRICLSNAKPAKKQTKRKQGFKTDFSFHNTSITLLSPFNEKCFCFKTFLMFWLSVKNFAFCYLAFVSSGFFNFDWSVRQNAPWMNQNCFVVTWLMTYVCLHILHPHQKKNT